MRLNQPSSHLHVLPFPQPLHPLHSPRWYYNSDYVIMVVCMYIAIKYVAHELYETIVTSYIASYLGSDFMFASNFMLCIQQSRDMQQSDNLIIDKLLKLMPPVTHSYALTLSSKDSNSFPHPLSCKWNYCKCDCCLFTSATVVRESVSSHIYLSVTKQNYSEYIVQLTVLLV